MRDSKTEWTRQVAEHDEDDAQTKLIRQEMNSASELMDRIQEKSSEVSTICRGLVNPRSALYQGLEHSADFHHMCFEWAGVCLAYARPRSLEYVSALRARAHLHYHIGQFDEAARDARSGLDQLRLYKLADPLGTAKRLKELLSRAEARAIEQRPRPHPGMRNYEPVDLKSQRPQLKQSNPEHPCLADGAEPAYNESWGRHLVAKRDIRVGEMILVEDLTCCVLVQDKIHQNCAYCSARADCGVACDECVHVVYCSERCKTDAWRDYHDVECLFFQEMSQRNDRDDCLPALRLLIKFIKTEGLDNVIEIAQMIDRHPESYRKKFPQHKSTDVELSTCSSEFGMIYSLKSRAGTGDEMKTVKKCLELVGLPQEELHEIDQFPDYEYDGVLRLVLDSLRDPDELIDEDIDDDTLWAVRKIFKKFKMIFQANSHWFGLVPESNNLHNYHQEPICFTLSYYASLLNHDCFHNAMLSIAKGRKLIVYATAPIKKNEQITINYSHLASFGLDTETRRIYIAQTKHFICRCQGCRESWKVLDNLKIPDGCLPAEVEASAVMDEQTSDNNWYLTRQQILSNKIIVDLIYKHMKKISPATAFVKAGPYVKHIVQAYNLMYGTECTMSDKCHYD